MEIIGGGKPAQGTHQHHSLNPQIEDAASLSEHFTDRCQQDGDAGLDGDRKNENEALEIHRSNCELRLPAEASAQAGNSDFGFEIQDL